MRKVLLDKNQGWHFNEKLRPMTHTALVELWDEDIYQGIEEDEGAIFLDRTGWYIRLL